MVEKGLRDLLINDPTVASMTGGSASPFVPGNRVRPILLPEGSNFPAIVYQVVGTSYVTSMDGVNVLQMRRFQIDCFGKNARAAKNLAQAVHNLLDGFRGTLSDASYVQACLPNQDVDTFEYDPQVFRVSCDFNVWFIPFTVPQSLPVPGPHPPYPTVPIGFIPVWTGTQWIPEPAFEIWNVVNQSAGTYHAQAGDLVICDTTDGNITVVLPLSANNEGHSVAIRLLEQGYSGSPPVANTVTAVRSGSDTLDGETSLLVPLNAVLTADGGSLWVALY